MTCHQSNYNGSRIFVCGYDEYEITCDKGKKHRFAWHRYLGPIVLNKRGDQKTKVPKSFWPALDKWENQHGIF